MGSRIIEAGRLVESGIMVAAQDALVRRWPQAQVSSNGHAITLQFDVGHVRLFCLSGSQHGGREAWCAKASMRYGADRPRLGQREAKGDCAEREDAVVAAELAIERMLVATATSTAERLHAAAVEGHEATEAVKAASREMDYKPSGAFDADSVAILRIANEPTSPRPSKPRGQKPATTPRA